MNKADWELLALKCAGSKGLSPVQIQKVLFLLGKELPDELGTPFYGFVPHNYGPFSRDVYTDAHRLSTEGLVSIDRPPGGYQEYRITPIGADRARILAGAASPRALAYLTSVVEWAQKQSFAGLVRAIYNKYPEFRANSVFQG